MKDEQEEQDQEESELVSYEQTQGKREKYDNKESKDSLLQERKKQSHVVTQAKWNPQEKKFWVQEGFTRKVKAKELEEGTDKPLAEWYEDEFITLREFDISEEKFLELYKDHNKTKIPKLKGDSQRVPISPGLKWEILSRDNITCVKCGRSPNTEKGVSLHVDHIIPVSKGGKTEYSNLQTLCSDCNLGKGAKLE